MIGVPASGSPAGTRGTARPRGPEGSSSFRRAPPESRKYLAATDRPVLATAHVPPECNRPDGSAGTEAAIAGSSSPG